MTPKKGIFVQNALKMSAKVSVKIPECLGHPPQFMCSPFRRGRIVAYVLLRLQYFCQCTSDDGTSPLCGNEAVQQLWVKHVGRKKEICALADVTLLKVFDYLLTHEKREQMNVLLKDYLNKNLSSGQVSASASSSTVAPADLPENQPQKKDK